MTVTISGSTGITGPQTDNDVVLNGVTVGLGGGSVSTNTAVGVSALNTNTTAGQSVAVGYQALYTSNYTSGNANNTAVGYLAGYATSTGTQNTFVGQSAGTSNTTGGQNSFYGYGSGVNSTTGSSNTALGFQSLQANTTASYNTAVGYQAGYTNSTGTRATFLGAYAGYNSTVNDNTGIGYSALGGNGSGTTGTSNTALGSYAIQGITSGASNTAIGASALYNNTTASNNTAVGYQAGYTNSTGAQNVFIGQNAGYLATSSYNLCIGANSGYSISSGSGNTFVGGAASLGGCGYYVTTGSKNTILGGYNGNQGGLDIRSSSNYIVLSDGDGNPAFIYRGSDGAAYVGLGSKANDGTFQLIGQAATNSGPFLGGLTGTYGSITAQWYIGSNSALKGGTTYSTLTATAGGTSGGVSLTSGATAWVSASDSRLKNVTGTYTTALADIAQIQPVKFTWKDDATNKPQVGVIAQSVQPVVPEAIDNIRHSKNDETDYLGVRYTELIPLLIASIQELNTLVTTQSTTIATMQAQIVALTPKS